MTVRDLIAELIEHDMNSEVVIRGNNGLDYEEFSDINVTDDHKLTGPDDVVIDFQTDGKAFIDNDDLKEMEEKIEELEDEE